MVSVLSIHHRVSTPGSIHSTCAACSTLKFSLGTSGSWGYYWDKTLNYFGIEHKKAMGTGNLDLIFLERDPESV